MQRTAFARRPAATAAANRTFVRTIDPALAVEGIGYGGVATAWWQSHRNAFTCDGQVHVQWWTADTIEYSRGQLAKGWGYVQFCITHDFRVISVARYEWDQVVVNDDER